MVTRGYQWLHCSYTVVILWLNYGYTMVTLWLHYGYTMVHCGYKYV